MRERIIHGSIHHLIINGTDINKRVRNAPFIFFYIYDEHTSTTVPVEVADESSLT